MLTSAPTSIYLTPYVLLPLLLLRVWEVTTGEVLNTLIHHNEAVLHLRFANGLMVTCSKDRSIAVWDMASPTDISLRRVLVGHRAAVNVVDFDDKYIVSASGDRTIKVSRWSCRSVFLQLFVNRPWIMNIYIYAHHWLKSPCTSMAALLYTAFCVASLQVWSTSTCEFVRTLNGHKRGIACLQYRDRLVVSGSSDNTIRYVCGTWAQ